MTKMMNKWTFVTFSRISLSLLLAIALSISSFSVKNASAAPAYAQYQTTDSVQLTNCPQSTGACTDYDVTFSWYSVIKGLATVAGKTAVIGNQSYVDNLTNAINNPTQYGWAVFQTGYGNLKNVTVCWSYTTPASRTLVFNSAYSYKLRLTPGYMQCGTLTFGDQASTNRNVLSFYDQNNSYVINQSHFIYDSGAFRNLDQTGGNGTAPYVVPKVLFFNFDITYPSDYVGTTYSSNASIKYIPKVDLSVSNRTVNFKICNKSDCLPPGFPSIGIGWSVMTIDDTNPQTIASALGNSDDSSINTGTVELPANGQYYLYVQYQAIPPMQKPADQKWSVLKMRFVINGTSYATSSTQQQCDLDGNCQNYIGNYKDCSSQAPTGVFDWGAFIPYVTCQVTNMGIWITNSIVGIFTYLFIPDLSAVSHAIQSLLTGIQNSLGFLWAPFQLIINVFQLFSNQATNPVGFNCDIGAIPIFGASAHIQLCAWRSNAPQLFNMMQVALDGGISIGIIFMFWRRINKLFGRDIEEYEGDEDYSDLQGARWYDDRTGESGSIHDGSAKSRGGSR